MGNRAQVSGGGDGYLGRFLLQQHAACCAQPDAEVPHCCHVSSMENLSFDEVKRLIRMGAAVSTAEEPFREEGDGASAGVSHAALSSVAGAGEEEETVPSVPKEISGLSSGASCWSVESEPPVELNSRVLDGSEQALEQLRAGSNLVVDPGVEGFVGFVEVGTLESEAAESSPRGSLPPSAAASSLAALAALGYPEATTDLEALATGSPEATPRNGSDGPGSAAPGAEAAAPAAAAAAAAPAAAEEDVPNRVCGPREPQGDDAPPDGAPPPVAGERPPPGTRPRAPPDRSPPPGGLPESAPWTLPVEEALGQEEKR